MAGYRAVLKRKVLGGFETVHVPDQEFGEVNPMFFKEFNNLKPVWNLIDADGNTHDVTFNNSETLPSLTEGWTDLRDFYQFEGMRQIMLTYVGQSRFILNIGRRIADTDDIPSFHSMSTKLPNRKSYFFDVTLTNLQMAVPSELALPPDFNDFLWDGDFDNLFLCNGNPTEGIIKTDIEYKSSESLNTKLKNGWETFCKNNSFQIGDTIRFKFFDGKNSPFVHVYRTNP